MNISAELPAVNTGSAEEDEEGVADGPLAAEVGRAVDDPAADDAAPVAVLAVTLDIELSIVTGYAVRKSDGSLGILLINKGEQSFEVAADLPESPRGVSARRLGRAEYDAGSGPAQLSVRVESRRVTITLPATSMVGLEVR